MGYQLWTSPITGYRRKGTRLAELRSVLGAGILARTILEPLQCCPAEAPAQEMQHILEQRGFDVAGVQNVKDGPVIGFVTKDALKDGTVNKHIQPMSAEQLISDACSLADLLTVMRAKERVFVLLGSGVKGIVTRADLNKPPVRVYLFGLTSLLEMHLRFWVSSLYPDESWKNDLKEERVVVATKLQVERRARNEEIMLLDCLQLCDKRDLVVKNAEVRAKLGLGSKNKAETFLKRAEDLRNRLAHSQHDLVEGASWEELIEVVEKIEAFIHASDDIVEKNAKATGQNSNALMGSDIENTHFGRDGEGLSRSSIS